MSQKDPQPLPVPILGQDADLPLLYKAAGLPIAKDWLGAKLNHARALLLRDLGPLLQQNQFKRPYSPFALWFLFGGDHHLPEHDPKYREAMGAILMDCALLTDGPPQEAAAAVVGKIGGHLQELRQAGAPLRAF